jgi:exodeoxyribonuclease VII large subunit
LRHPATRARERLGALSQLLSSLSHKSVLERGFVLVRDEAGRILPRASAAAVAERVEMEFADGCVTADVTGASSERRPPALKPVRKHAAETHTEPKVTDKQGKLF